MVVKVKKPIQVGDVVKWTRRNGLPDKGMVVKVDSLAPSGKWLHIEAKSRPGIISKVREGSLTKV